MGSLVVHPLGWQFGREGEPATVLKSLAMEMLGYLSDLREMGIRAKEQALREEYNRRADDLEKYAVAVYAVAVQMDKGGYSVESHKGLIELAEKHQVALPDWMKENSPQD